MSRSERTRLGSVSAAGHMTLSSRAQYLKSDLTGLSWSAWTKSRSDLKTGYFYTDPDSPDPEDQDSAPVTQSSLGSRLKSGFGYFKS